MLIVEAMLILITAFVVGGVALMIFGGPARQPAKAVVRVEPPTARRPRS
jgi:hypothetical protein